MLSSAQHVCLLAALCCTVVKMLDPVQHVYCWLCPHPPTEAVGRLPVSHLDVVSTCGGSPGDGLLPQSHTESTWAPCGPALLPLKRPLSRPSPTSALVITTWWPGCLPGGWLISPQLLFSQTVPRMGVSLPRCHLPRLLLQPVRALVSVSMGPITEMDADGVVEGVDG